MGRISLGRLNWRKILWWLKIEVEASVTALEKNIQGMIPERIKTGKLCISTLNTIVKTNAIADMIKSGLAKARYNPKAEAAYLAFRFDTDIFHNVCRY